MTFKTALLIISSLTCTSFGAPASVQDTKSGDTKDMPVLGTPEKLHGGFEFTEGPTPISRETSTSRTFRRNESTSTGRMAPSRPS